MSKKEDGFTLVEIMIVIIILAVLTGIAVVSYINFTPRAKESRTEIEMRNISTALSTYYVDNNAYPLTANYPNAIETGGYMGSIPDNDVWNTAYQYTSSDGLSYTLESFGIDGADGGGYDIIFSDGVLTEDGAYNN